MAWGELGRQIGVRYAKARFENFVVGQPAQQVAMQNVADWSDQLPELIRGGNGGLILFGPRGTGKDHLAVSGLWVACVRHGLSVAWVEGQTLFARARDLLDRDASEERWVREYVSPKVLLISDPFPQAGELTEYQLSVLWRICDSRYRRCHPTWLTCNVADGDELDRRLGPALSDRLKDGSLGVFCNWPTHRGKFVRTADGTFGKVGKR